jgi:hypothetical protein
MNDLSITQIANIVNNAVKQATGSEVLSNLATKDFVSVAQTALLTGEDNLAIGLSQVMAQTIFAVRPYKRKMTGIQRTTQEWGNHVRKINFVDQEVVDDAGYPGSTGTLKNGQSVDMYTVNLPKVIQTNFYGKADYEFYSTFSREQLRAAMENAGQFSSFVAGQMLHNSNQREKRIDTLSHGALCNFIGAKVEGDPTNVLKLVSIYNNLHGTELNTATVRKKENFFDFAQWMYGYLKTLIGYMGQRTIKYHLNLTAGDIARQSTPADLHMYMLSSFENDVDARVLSNTYNDKELNMIDHEKIDFWQSMDSPDAITVNCSYTGADGTVKTSSEGETAQSDVIGVIFDRDAVGYTLFNESADTTPMNSRGRYYNTWYNWQGRFYNDITENGIVLILE